MRRKIYDKLLAWKSRGGKTALLVRGARRVGKSYIVEEFARREYRSYIRVDFNDLSPYDRQLILDSLHNRDQLFSYLQLTFHTKLYERQSLIIFDEVQECPQARAAIKYLVADGRYDFVETGSLLSIRKNTKDIVIPSEEEPIDMHPMDFEEFLWANGEEMLADCIRQNFDTLTPLPQAIHRRAMQLFREYMVLGGMPQVVAAYLRDRDFNAADREKMVILALYRGDIVKHAGTHALKVESIFDAIPSELSKHEKKFRLAKLSAGAKMRDYIEPFTWLQDARFVNLCFGSTEPSMGLAMTQNRTTVKCYLADTGLLYALAFLTLEEKNDVYRKIILGKLTINEGMFMENIVAQMLRASGHALYFYSNASKQKDDRMELDFLVPKSKITNKHNVNIIEVKSGSRYSLVSLQKALVKYAVQVHSAIVVHPDNVEQREGITFLPVYMTTFL